MCAGEAPLCDAGACVQCLNDDDCVNGVCDPNNVCVECTNDDHCPDGVCDPSNVCVECTNDDHCPDGVCDEPNTTCVGCLENTDCPAETPVCDRDNTTCVVCLVDADCDGGQVCQGNACVDPEVCDDGVDNDGDGATDCDDTDCVGQPECTRAPAEGELVITEIMYNPNAVFDVFGEWIEVYNTTNLTLDLQGVELRDNTGQHTFPAGTTVAPGAYAVLVASTNADFNGGVVGGIDYNGISLGNDGDVVSLVLPGAPDITLDAVDFSEGWPSAAGEAAQFDGALDPAVDETSDTGNWCAATEAYGRGDRGTPGGPNSNCP